ncbi:hypothetical protein [Microbacterium sp. SORGH_AS_0888]|uniref:hypothetical protein n=1 Tax=Microbacterium sp. SORGH_AS_0888 TaxID=3041791 RepID=UPI00277DC363|nr:hypothetical protein [Microbacterium sp. SORGH_AS_0888]MDQ1131395.1 hypothetical protein [Microbacterium sp. SORGH_AS_0888]
MISVRFVLTVLALAFTGYLVGRGLFWTAPVPHPVVFVLAMALYLAVTWLCVLWGYPTRRPAPAQEGTVGRGGDQLPLWICALALATALVLPPAIAYGVGPDAVDKPYSAWFIGALGALMVVLVVRRRPWPAWSGTAVMAGWAAVLLGLVPALGLGLVGSVMWVTAAQFFVYALDRADRDTQRLGEIQRSASAVHAAQGSQQRERRIQVQRALAVAGPILARTIATGGDLGPDGRVEARIAEGRLRDELRGPRLLDEAVREALDATRRRGAIVTLLDEGGLEGLADEQLRDIRAELAATLRDAHSDRLFVRTSPDARVAVTVVGRASSTLGLSDEDSVDLWREIERPAASSAR